MTFTFISHASEDKIHLVKPLVEALVIEGVKVWIDRPGHGESHFGFDSSYIRENQIRGIRSGDSFDQAIIQALNESSAVLFCLSRAFTQERSVLRDEATIAYAQKKLVACILDDLPLNDIPHGGLLSEYVHYERVRPDLLSSCLAELRKFQSDSKLGSASPDLLPTDLRRSWEVVRKLKCDIETRQLHQNRDFTYPEPSDDEWQNSLARLIDIPVSRVIRPSEIPEELDALYSERLSEPARSRQLIVQAMRLRKQANPENAPDNHILINMGDLPPVATTPPREFWSCAFLEAGRKSPRTLAALIFTPFAPKIETVKLETEKALVNFIADLQRP